MKPWWGEMGGPTVSGLIHFHWGRWKLINLKDWTINLKAIDRAMGAGLQDWITQGQRIPLLSPNTSPRAGYKQNQVKALKWEMNWATSDTKRLRVCINVFTPKRKWILCSVHSSQWLCRYRWSRTASPGLKIWLSTNCKARGWNSGLEPSQEMQTQGHPDNSESIPVSSDPLKDAPAAGEGL